jgi:very-short-patch-repair endonuclease
MEVDGSAHHNREDMDEHKRPPWHGGDGWTCRVRDKESTMGNEKFSHMLYSIFLENAQLLQWFRCNGNKI